MQYEEHSHGEREVPRASGRCKGGGPGGGQGDQQCAQQCQHPLVINHILILISSVPIYV